MYEEKFNQFLDEEIGSQELDEETKRAVLAYTKALEIAKIRFDYQPSEIMHRKVLRKVRSKRKVIFQLLVASAAAFALFALVTTNPSKKIVPTTIERAAVNEVFDYLSLVKLVNDGF